MIFNRSVRLLGLASAFVSVHSVSGTTYYVSPTGSDSNNGTSPNSPWQSLTKVDSTTFAPGSTILLQDGGSWYGSQLIASSSGTPSQPITYGSYGSGPMPTIWGSVPVSYTQLQALGGSTYFYPSTTPVNAFFIDHGFWENADLVSGQTTAAGNIAYVEANPGTSYYSSGPNPGVYVNTGIDRAFLSSLNFSAAVTQNLIFSNSQSNLVFENLNVSESAAEAANGSGYGIRVQDSSNVQVLNCNVSNAGVHAVGVLDSPGFLGENINASSLLPGQGYGGATAFVSYADFNVTNVSNQWINDTFTNPNGSYQGFITHNTPSTSDPAPITSILVQNLQVVNPAPTSPAITIYSASAGENVSIIGGSVNGDVQVQGNNTLIDGITLTGQSEIQLGGNNNTVQNTIINGDIPNINAGRNGAIEINGYNNIIRFSSINLGYGGAGDEPAIALDNPDSNTQIYGNVINSQYAMFYLAFGESLTGISASNNLFSGTSTPMVIYPLNGSLPLSSWPTSASADELISASPEFTDAAAGNLSLVPNATAAYVFNPATNQYVMYDYYGDVRPTILESLGAVQAPATGITAIGWNVDSDGNWSNPANWTSGTVPNGTDIIALFGSVNSAPRTVTVDAPQTIGVLYFSSSVSFTIAGSSALSFNSSSGTSAIDVSAGNHQISAPINLSDPTDVNIAGSSVLTIAGTVTGPGALIANGGGTLLISAGASIQAPLIADGNITFGGHGASGGFLVQTIPSLTIGPLGMAVVADQGLSNRSNRTLLVTTSLTFSSPTSGVLDLTTNDLDVPNGNYSQILGYVLEGLSSGGLGGIISSTAMADTTHITTLAVIPNTNGGRTPLFGASGPLGLFDGTSPAATDVLVRFTYYGDATLQGSVSATDYSRIDNSYLTEMTTGNPVSGWYNGDFNYDGVVNGSDYTLIDNSFNMQGASLASQATPTAQVTTQIAAVTAVPEPAALLAPAAAVIAVLARRRRRMRFTLAE